MIKYLIDMQLRYADGVFFVYLRYLRAVLKFFFFLFSSVFLSIMEHVEMSTVQSCDVYFNVMLSVSRVSFVSRCVLTRWVAL